MTKKVTVRRLSTERPSTERPSTERPATRGRVIAFIAAVLALSGIGGAVAIAESGELGNPDAAKSAGMLLFIIGPILVAAILRTFAGDGWGDAGMRLRLRGNGRWYLLALLLFPVLSAIAIGLGAITGNVTFAPGAAGEFAVLFAAGLVLHLVYAAFEEFGWRGYLEPRLANLGVAPARRHLIVALVWGVWHIPYVLAVDVMTDLPIGAYIPMFLLAIVPMAFIYGVMRDRTLSVWPAVLMHGIANAVAFPLLSDDVVASSGGPAFAARPEGIITLVGLSATAWFVWQRGRGARPHAAP